MILIKTDNVILNTNLTNEKNSENKSVFSKKSSLSSADLELSMIDNESVSSENVSKIKQKLDYFYHLNHKDDIDLKSHLKINSNGIGVKSEKDEKGTKEETDFLNLEGLLLTQRKIYSQIRYQTKKVDIEKKSLFNYENKRTPVSHKITTENNLKVVIDLKLNKNIGISASESKKENKLDIDGLGVFAERKVVTQKVDSVEKKKNTNHNAEKIDNKLKTHQFIESNKKQLESNIESSIESNIENKGSSYKEKRSFSKDNTALKIKENALGTQNNIIEKAEYSTDKNTHLKSNGIDNNNLLFNTEKPSTSIDKSDGKKVREEFNQEVNNFPFFNTINQKYQQKIQDPLIDKKLLDIPALSLLYKEVSKITQPPTITYVFKKWGNELHQMKINFDAYKNIQLIASTGRVYQSSLENFNQYQGRLALSLEHDNYSMPINAIDPSDDKEDEK